MANVLIMYTDHRASERHLARLRHLLGDGTVYEAVGEQDAVAHADDVNVVLGHRYLQQILHHECALQWVQSSGGGHDHLPWEELRDRQITLTRATVASQVIAQHAVMLAFALNRLLPDCLALQQQRVWGGHLYDSMPPQPSRALVLGFGSIGQGIARILTAASIGVTAVARSRNPDRAVAGVSLITDGSWRDLIETFDMVLLALPNSTSTISMLDASSVAKLNPSAVVVNVGRAETMDVNAIVERLRSGTLAGAALDVPPGREPLNAASELWTVPNLIISPYVAARYANRWDQLEVFIEQQVGRWRNGEPLHEMVAW